VPARPKNTYVREDHILAHLPRLLANGEPPAARGRHRTRHGVRVVGPVSDQDLVGCLRAREITLTYDPRTKTLQADTPAAVTTVTGRAS
jgi:site-specific DNA recombinase